MIPQLFVRTHWILAIEQVVRPFGVTQGVRLEWSLDAGLTAITELTFGSLATPGTFDQ
jgi:hypothetical protein